ncbi:NUDIX hydrolase [Shimia sagamensis]|uniref:8-oxo-dGTP pyrophosphatase MutT, NUDIX family n=1 Tax=Shimia sagamensis TaxID=1566352 RepID=A0ABY1NZ41_9RHOB|nr:NUDIX hydrolase [Shimia sagamensis]SMP22107.1 8-oxo-dGTP pyrophosphatase MutT, NUDIX family [Shimia sagamensis]
MGLLDPATTEAMIRKAQKRGKNIQFAALPYRIHKNKTEVLLITSRGTRQWLLPKGWPMDDLKPHKAAAQEAWEEAGILGRAHKHCLGTYRYRKARGAMRGQTIRVMVFPLEVHNFTRTYPEMGQRQRKWLSPKKAAKHIGHPDLAKLVRNFDPTFITPTP